MARTSVDEFRITVAETYDIIVEPQEDRAYTLFAESMDRSGYARGTLAPRQGMTAPIPERRSRPLLTMADMGMDMKGMDQASADGGGGGMSHHMHGMHMASDSMQQSLALNTSVMHGPDHHGPGNSMVAMQGRIHSAGTPRDGSAVTTTSSGSRQKATRNSLARIAVSQKSSCCTAAWCLPSGISKLGCATTSCMGQAPIPGGCSASLVLKGWPLLVRGGTQ